KPEEECGKVAAGRQHHCAERGDKQENVKLLLVPFPFVEISIGEQRDGDAGGSDESEEKECVAVDVEQRRDLCSGHEEHEAEAGGEPCEREREGDGVTAANGHHEQH